MCTGLGIAELVNLVLLLLCRYIFAWEGLYQILQYLYFLLYLLEDLLPLDRAGYHLMLVMTKEPVQSSVGLTMSYQAGVFQKTSQVACPTQQKELMVPFSLVQQVLIHRSSA